MLLGWLASRLGWAGVGAPVHAGDLSQISGFRSAEGAVSVSIEPAPALASLLPGTLEAVALECRADGGVATFAVERLADGVCASQRSTLPVGRAVDRMVPLTLPTLASLLGRELGLAGRDQIYEASLAVAGAMIG